MASSGSGEHSGVVIAPEVAAASSPFSRLEKVEDGGTMVGRSLGMIGRGGIRDGTDDSDLRERGVGVNVVVSWPNTSDSDEGVKGWGGAGAEGEVERAGDPGPEGAKASD
jgi:hypothetical protein